ncbi:VanZ family protein [Microbulbifer variabilis]|uniref:VanZ family protein n=1 Tax=Microbulbifer variabilis TaxID=266805 RepID=UPI001CFD74E6|nr:VanZ family protein [Microbulbifer variabilis]
MHKFLALVALTFFTFILWIIYLADTGSNSIFFTIVAAIPYGDKLGHIFLFGFLSLLATAATRFNGVDFFKLKVYYVVLAVLLFALAEEISQAFLPSRTFDYFDLGGDLIGILIASLIGNILERERNEKLQ